MAERKRRAPIRLVLLTVALGTTATACSPFDDVMVAIFGRSMRDQSSFDPYENTLMPPEGSVPFAAGNMPAGLGQVNVGQSEAAMDMLKEIARGKW